MDKAKTLLEKFRAGTLSQTERAELEMWYTNHASSSPPLANEEIYRKKMAELDAAFPFGLKLVPVKTLLWPRIVVAASILLVFSIGFYYYQSRIVYRKPSIISQSDIVPGKQGATLTLSSGKKIRLADIDNGKLAEEAGILITKTADGKLIYKMQDNSITGDQLNFLSTTKGETVQLQLPDGTEVWLNSESSLSYTSKLLHNGIREVRLDGEGYFEVAKDKAHPFIVNFKDQFIKVLGTHFNINAYNDESNTKTTLLEGSVIINNKVLLKPNEEAVISDKAIRVNTINSKDAIAWKNGEFAFNDEQLAIIMRKISRWYNVEIQYQDESIQNKSFGGTITRFGNVSDVLRMLELTGDVHFKIEGRRIIVTK